jgi:hypothetical protein
VFECVEKNSDYITIRHGNNYFRVRKDLFKAISSPNFYIGQGVLVNNKGMKATISDIMWHYDDREHYYFITINRKKKSKRYKAFELAGIV